MLVTIQLTDDQLAALKVAEDQVIYNHTRPVIHKPNDVVTFLGHIKGLRQEHCIVITLDKRNRIINRHTVSKGTLDASLVHPRDVFRVAIMDNANSIVIAHNHPSGDPEPSDDDMIVTKRLNTAGKLIGINVMDHMIMANTNYYSFKEHGNI